MSVSPQPVDAAVFDLDGVVTDTAAVHESAWRRTFEEVVARSPSLVQDRTPMTTAEYRRFVDGKPRCDGVRDWLRCRGVSLPWGEVDDPPGWQSVCAIGNLKDRSFAERIHEEGVRTFAGTVRLVRSMQATGMPTAVVSASRHCREVLQAAGLGDLFPVIVDGVEADRLQLAGKPDPATFLEATRRLGVPVGRTALFEDALAGVQAGRRGGFGLVVGVDRTDGGGVLLANGADVVVGDLGRISVTANEAARRQEDP